MRRKKDTEKKTFITSEVLLEILKAGAVLGVALVAPQALKVFKNTSQETPWDAYHPSSVTTVSNRLYRKGFVDIRYEKGKHVVAITEKGKTQVLAYALNHLEIHPMQHWDGKWRLVIFDIAERYRRARDTVRHVLKKAGFYQFQESVFICPYPCEKEIMYLREVLSVPHEMKIIQADRIENDEDLRQIFHLT